jgi:hypothetical protein
MANVELILTGINIDPNPMQPPMPHFPNQPPPPPPSYVFNFFIKADPAFGLTSGQPFGGITVSLRLPASLGFEEGARQAKQKIAEFAKDLADATQEHRP